MKWYWHQSSSYFFSCTHFLQSDCNQEGRLCKLLEEPMELLTVTWVGILWIGGTNPSSRQTIWDTVEDNPLTLLFGYNISKACFNITLVSVFPRGVESRGAMKVHSPYTRQIIHELLLKHSNWICFAGCFALFCYLMVCNWSFQSAALPKGLFSKWTLWLINYDVLY